MNFGYPAGCTQEMHDRAFADETREKCQTCEGTGHRVVGDVFDGAHPCVDCSGTGFEEPADSREDDAYEQMREDESNG